jgi:hypothetical protein
MALRRVEDDPQLALADARGVDELRQLLVDAKPGILQVDRVDGVRRHWHFDAGGADVPLLPESDQPRQPPAGLAFDNAVEIDEVQPPRPAGSDA